MLAATENQRSEAQTGSHRAHGGASRRWHFLRHYLEMVAAMFVGMAVFGGAVRAILALAGSDFPDQYPELTSLEMALTMSLGMVVWMRYRGHGWASTLEMAGVMFVPSIVLFPLLWLDVISGGSLLMIEHIAMLPLMYLVMLRRRDEYGG
jgi:flagellar biosynthetic protein FliP